MIIHKIGRLGLPVVIALAVIAGLYFQGIHSDLNIPHAQEGVLDLSQDRIDGVFEMTGEWEFYWDKLLTGKQITQNTETPVIVDAPGEWNYYETEGEGYPGEGKATYHIRVTGAQAGVPYGVRIQNLASAYRLYADDNLIAQNGSFGDSATAPVSGYRPQLGSFTPQSGSFDLVLQVSNNAYAVGGMWEPLIFGTYPQVMAYDKLFSNFGAASAAGLIVMCLFCLIFFAVQRKEKDFLILACIAALILMRLSITGDMAVTTIFPGMPIAGFGWIDYLTLHWIQFLLLYFVYCAYGGLVRKRLVIILFSYAAVMSILVLLLPLKTIGALYMPMNIVLFIVIGMVTAYLMRAAWQGQEGAPLLLGALSFILLFNLYGVFVENKSAGFYLLSNSAFEYMTLFFAQTAVVALRYRRAQKLEIAQLKSQIHPHFIHNALTSIISISRTDPDRARELLVDFSSYLRGFYDYEQDEQISFEQELELVRAYTALEQARFGDKLKVEYKIGTDDFYLPPLVLQPLVENAFVHGLREKEGSGMVTVYTERKKGGKVRIGVRDNGVGFHKLSSVRRGVGIANINRRLARLYRTRLIFRAPDDGGCEVYMEIPCKENSKHASLAD